MQTTILNLVPHGTSPNVYVVQGDIGRELRFDLYDGDKPYNIPDNAVITAQGTKSDNTVYAYSSEDKDDTLTFFGSMVTLKTTANMTAVAGKAKCTIGVKADGMDIETLPYSMTVIAGGISEEGLSESDFGTFQSIYKQTTKNKEDVETLKGQVETEGQQFINDITTKGTETLDAISAKEKSVQDTIDNFNKENADLDARIDSAAAKAATTAAETATENVKNSIKTEVFADIQNKGYRVINWATITIATDTWDSTAKTATVSVSGVTADNAVDVKPAEASFEAYSKAGIRATTQAEGTLTFLCEKIPTEAISVTIKTTT